MELRPGSEASRAFLFMATKVVNIKATKKYDVYIGRAGKGLDGYFGNPFSLDSFKGDRKACLEAYRKYFYKKLEEDEYFRNKILSLKDKVLGCFCWPDECHGDVIVEYLDQILCQQN